MHVLVPNALLFRLMLAVAAALVLAPVASGYPQRFVRVAHNPAERLASKPIEEFRYDHARRCVKHPRAGTVSLQHWLERHALGASWGILRCEKLGKHDYSLHADGRALDWHLDVHLPAERREAVRLIELMLAPDSAGNTAALARRMGIQEIIWDCRSWWSGGEGMEPYSACYNRHGKRRRHVDPTTAHRNHIHFGLNRAGARKATSFWRAAAS